MKSVQGRKTLVSFPEVDFTFAPLLSASCLKARRGNELTVHKQTNKQTTTPPKKIINHVRWSKKRPIKEPMTANKI